MKYEIQNAPRKIEGLTEPFFYGRAISVLRHIPRDLSIVATLYVA
jgi:hypothetical protein